MTASAYDKITLFGLRPVELLKLFLLVRQYYEWFVKSDKALSQEETKAGLNVDVRKCLWIDGLGRKVMLRKQAAPLAAKWLRELDDNVLAHDYM